MSRPVELVDMDKETKSRFPSVPVAALILVIGLGLLAYWGVRTVISAIPTPGDIANVFEPEPYEEIGPVTITAIRDLARLTTVETVQYTIVEKGTDEGWLAWARGDSLRMFAVARIGAGVDLSQLTVRDVTVGEDGVVELTVPAAEIQYVDPDEDATQVLERDVGFFTSGDPGLESDVRRIADEVLVDNAVEAGILEEAEGNARSVLTDFLLSLGYSDVVVEFEEPPATS
ncbi:MAG TPA: DUF4230 domain-containing protein [Acidimicrobiia bacterium]|jgi:hypothetical protein|nr:DUF4230 domain-containing protein [Acidimicrobiia bacterium]